MQKKIRDIIEKYHARLDFPETVPETLIPQLFWSGMLIWFLLWSLLPSLCVGNVFIDVAENVAWGDNFQFGYDKNPYFGAWITRFVFGLFRSDAFSYFMSQISVQAAVISVWVLGKKIFRSNVHALIAVLLTLMIPVFSHSACEFNDDVMEIGLWGLLFLFFYLAVRSGKLEYWILTGLAAGLAIMTKYLAVVPFLPLMFLLFSTKEGRASLKQPGPYLGLLLAFLFSLPNILWLAEHRFIAIGYAMERSQTATATLLNHISYPAGFLHDFVKRLVLPLLAVLLLFRRGKPVTDGSFDRKFLLCIFWGPVILTFFFSLISGGKILDSWITPYYVPAGLVILLYLHPEVQFRRLKILFAVFLIFTVATTFIFGYEYLYKRPYLRKRISYSEYPGRIAAEYAEKEWHARFGPGKIPYVIGSRKTSCNMVFYSKDMPKAFFEGDTRYSPWINPEDVLAGGAVILWDEAEMPDYVKKYREHLIILKPLTVPRENKRWFRRLAGNPPLTTIHCVILPPQSSRKEPRQKEDIFRKPFVFSGKSATLRFIDGWAVMNNIIRKDEK